MSTILWVIMSSIWTSGFVNDYQRKAGKKGLQRMSKIQNAASLIFYMPLNLGCSECNINTKMIYIVKLLNSTRQGHKMTLQCMSHIVIVFKWCKSSNPWKQTDTEWTWLTFRLLTCVYLSPYTNDSVIKLWNGSYQVSLQRSFNPILWEKTLNEYMMILFTGHTIHNVR